MDSLQSDRLHYRAWNSCRDKEWYFTMHSDPRIFYNTSKSTFRPITKESIDPIIKEFEAALLCVVVCKKSSPNPEEDRLSSESERIGVLLIKNIPPNQAQNSCADLGIELNPDMHGQGYGTEVLRWAINWAFKMANLHRVQLEAYGWNEIALKTYRKVGFQEEGRLRKAVWRDGQWWDEICMGILREEWSG